MDLDVNQLSPVATAWTINAEWAPEGVLNIETGDDKAGVATFTYDPVRGSVAPTVH